MKTHIFALIVAITLAVPGSAQVATVATPSPNSSASSSATYQTSAQPPTIDVTTPTIGLDPLFGRPEGQTVFIVPTQPMDTAPVLEDLHIMCRIIDKKVDPRAVAFAAGPRPSPTETALFQALSLGGQPHGNAEALYLQDYGVVFFVELPFPLDFSEPELQEQPQGQPGRDPVWQSVKEETLSGGRRRSQGRNAERTEAMNREATIAMTETLLHTLKHAANIRSLQRNEKIVIRVVGQQEAQGGRSNSPRGRRGAYGDPYAMSQYGGPGRPRPSAPPLGPTALIMATTKADVDAYSAGALTFEQFRAKAGVLTVGSAGLPGYDVSDVR